MVGEEREGNCVLIAEHARTTRLAMGMGVYNRIPAENIRITLHALSELMGYAHTMGVDRIRLAATGALRYAENGREVAIQIERETGILCDILTDKEESFLSFTAVRNRVSPQGSLTVADVGGATVEVMYGNFDTPSDVQSYTLGCIPMTETWFHDDPPGESAWRKARSAILEELHSILSVDSTIVGCGGAFTSTAALLRGLRHDTIPLRGYEISENNVTEIGLLASTLTIKGRYALPGIGQARSVLVPAGTAIIAALLSKWGRPCLVSDRGFAWGLLLDTWKRVSSDT